MINEMNDGWTLTTKPCEEIGCRDGDDEYNDYEPCRTCKGRGELDVEVHGECGLTEDECPCFREAEKEIAA